MNSPLINSCDSPIASLYWRITVSFELRFTNDFRATPSRRSRSAERDRLLGVARKSFVKRNSKDTVIRQYNDAIGESQELMSGEFMSAFNLKSESDSLRNA